MDLFCKSVMQDMSFRGVDQASIICLQLLRSYDNLRKNKRLGLSITARKYNELGFIDRP